MPVIVRVTCAGCGHDEYIMDHFVFFDGTGFVGLRHPGERHDLERLGYTWKSALLEGRLYRNGYFVCLDCRSLVLRRTLAQPTRWDFLEFSFDLDKFTKVTLWIVAPLLMVLALVYNWSGCLVGAVLVILGITVEWIASRLRRRATERQLREARQRLCEMADAKSREQLECSHCGSARVTDYYELLWKRNRDQGDRRVEETTCRCPKCGDISLRHDPNYTSVA
jgi:hypothetical protein